MNPDLDALATRLYVTIDDLLIDHPDWRPERPAVGITPQLCDAELVTLAVIQALLGFTSEARFIRHAHTHLRALFPYLPQRPAYNKRAPPHRHDHATHHRCPRPRPPVTAQRPVVGRFHTSRMRPQSRDGETIRQGRLRQLRLLRQPHPPQSGTTKPATEPAPHDH